MVAQLTKMFRFCFFIGMYQLSAGVQVHQISPSSSTSLSEFTSLLVKLGSTFRRYVFCFLFFHGNISFFVKC